MLLLLLSSAVGGRRLENLSQVKPRMRMSRMGLRFCRCHNRIILCMNVRETLPWTGRCTALHSLDIPLETGRYSDKEQRLVSAIEKISVLSPLAKRSRFPHRYSLSNHNHSPTQITNLPCLALSPTKCKPFPHGEKSRGSRSRVKIWTGFTGKQTWSPV